MQQRLKDAAVARKTCQDAQRHNAHHIVDDCRAQNRCADARFQTPELSERLHGDADTCRREDTSNEERVHQLRVICRFAEPAHEQQRNDRTECDRHEHARQRNT